jgi:hypothetical protein
MLGLKKNSYFTNSADDGDDLKQLGSGGVNCINLA